MTEIGFIAENIGYCGGFPIVRRISVGNCTVLACFGVSVHSRLEYLPVPKDITNVLGADARGAEGEYFPNDGRGFGINDQMVPLQGILQIAVWDLGADTLATFGFSLYYGSYLLTGVTCVPLVEKVLKRRKLVAIAIERIEIVIDGNITNSKPWECDFCVMSDLNIVSSKTGEVFGNQRTDSPFSIIVIIS